MGAASLVLGLIALVIAVIFPIYGLVGLGIGIVGIVLGAIGKKKGKKCAVGGMVLSIIAVAICMVIWLACAACAAAVL